MKFTVKFHDEDSIADAICEAVTNELESHRYEMTPDEFDRMRERRAEALFEAVDRLFLREGQVVVEFDVEAGAARVLWAER